MSRPRLDPAPRINLLPVHLILQVDLKVGYGHVRAGRVQLPGAVAAFDAWQEGVRRVGGQGLVRLRGDGLACRRVDGAVAH